MSANMPNVPLPDVYAPRAEIDDWLFASHVNAVINSGAPGRLHLVIDADAWAEAFETLAAVRAGKGERPNRHDDSGQ